MKNPAKPKRLLASNRNRSRAILALPLSLALMSCQRDMPTGAVGPEKPEPAGTAEAARVTPGSTSADIIWIHNLAELRAMNTLWGNYKLANNIDASATAQSPFVPIGGNFPFTGTLDGNNFTISNLTISGGSNTGIFQRAYFALFKRLRLANVKVTGGYSTGALAGYAEGVDLMDTYISGTVTGNAQADRIGLAFGSVGTGTRISRCHTRGTVKGRAFHMGGLVGHAAFYGIYDQNDDLRILIDEVFVQDTTLPGITTGSTMVAAGGLVGTLVGGVITNISAVGSITGRYAAGGLIGHVINNDPNSVQSYVRGALSRGTVTDNANANRTGAIGMMTGDFSWGPGAFYDKDTDGGITNPNIANPAQCQQAFSSNELKLPHGDPGKFLGPYLFGELITPDNYIQLNRPACAIGSGSDGDWGFGTCNSTPIWALNTDKEYNTLLRIPRAGDQPK